MANRVTLAIASGEVGGTPTASGPGVERAYREKIYNAESVLRQFEQIELPPRHIFAEGLYCRELLIPAGVMLTGKIHKKDALIVIHYGEISVMTEEGMKHLKGPATFRGKAGVKRVGFAHTDTLWSSVMATDETDLDIIEKELYEEEPEGMESMFDFHTGKPRQWMEDRQDYLKAIAEAGMTPEYVDAIVNIESDLDLSPIEGVERVVSKINNVGICATIDFEPGALIGFASRDSKRTLLGRYVNHSAKPNCHPERGEGEDIKFVAHAKILTGEEITIDYRETMAMRGMLGVSK